MKIVTDLCTGCGLCRPYCPVGAIQPAPNPPGIAIDRDSCVECEVCLGPGVCAEGALGAEELRWPRLVRSLFSNPRSVHEQTRVPGRGTEEMKTNDLTGRIPPGRVSLSIELGRPCLGTDFRDIQVVTECCAACGCRFEPENPLTSLLADPEKGKFKPDILEERVLSAVVEVSVPVQGLPAVLEGLRLASTRIKSVFSLGLSTLASRPAMEALAGMLSAAGFPIRPNGKTNVGLGRPLFYFARKG